MWMAAFMTCLCFSWLLSLPLLSAERRPRDLLHWGLLVVSWLFAHTITTTDNASFSEQQSLFGKEQFQSLFSTTQSVSLQDAVALFIRKKRKKCFPDDKSSIIDHAWVKLIRRAHLNLVFVCLFLLCSLLSRTFFICINSFLHGKREILVSVTVYKCRNWQKWREECIILYTENRLTHYRIKFRKYYRCESSQQWWMVKLFLSIVCPLARWASSS